MVLTFIKRPTSPVSYENAPQSVEDVICPGSDDEESSDERREKKRRRIEAFATQYLQGRALLIQTAGLKGPFESGWRNPWARQTKAYYTNDIQRIPEAEQVPVAALSPEQEQPSEPPLEQPLKQSLEQPLEQPLEQGKSKSNIAEANTDTTSERSAIEVVPIPKLTRDHLHENKEHAYLRDDANISSSVETWLERTRVPSSSAIGEFHEKLTPTPSPVKLPRKNVPKRPTDAKVEQTSKFANCKKARSPKPSVRTIPPSTALPEFRYRYTRTGSTTTSERARKAHDDAVTEQLYAHKGSRTSSTSSSGSSAFAEALEAAQTKASSGGQSTSCTSSQKIQANKSPFANAPEFVKRMSFTVSGSSIKGKQKQKGTQKGYGKKPRRSQHLKGRIQERKSATNSASLSNVLPEAQVQNVPPPLAPSGPSTNLIKTDQQSPPIANAVEDDSFLNLSTQAAVLKAQDSLELALIETPVTAASKGLLEKSSTMDNSVFPVSTRRRSTRINKLTAPNEPAASTQAMIDSFSPFAASTTKKSTNLKTPSKVSNQRKSSPFEGAPGQSQTVESYGQKPTDSTLQSRRSRPIDANHTIQSDHVNLVDGEHHPSALQNPSAQETAAPPFSTDTTKTSFSILPDGTFTEGNINTAHNSLLQDGQHNAFPLDVDLPPPPTLPEIDDLDGHLHTDKPGEWRNCGLESAVQDKVPSQDEASEGGRSSGIFAGIGTEVDEAIDSSLLRRRSSSKSAEDSDVESERKESDAEDFVISPKQERDEKPDTQDDDAPDHDFSPATSDGTTPETSDGNEDNDDKNLDLNAVFDEACTFLGDWDVDAEAKAKGTRNVRSPAHRAGDRGLRPDQSQSESSQKLKSVLVNGNGESSRRRGSAAS